MIPYFEIIEVFIVVSWLFETYLDWRQRQKLFNRSKVPTELEQYITKETFVKSQVYYSHSLRFLLLTSLKFRNTV